MLWIIAACCAVALGCAYTSWRAPKWPQGETYIKKYRQHTVRVVFADDVTRDFSYTKDRLANAAAMAVYAADHGWAIARARASGWKHYRKAKTVCVLFRGRKHMQEKQKQWGKDTELYGYLTKVPHGIHYVPLVVINEDQEHNLIENGEIVIHEMMHALSNTYIATDKIHDDPTVWAVSEEWFRASAQTHGRITYRSLTEELRRKHGNTRATEESTRTNH